MKTTKQSTEHYIWGDNCDGWHLLKREDLSVIYERMPAGTSETKHYHRKSRQFFFIISGTATIDMEGEQIILHPKEGIEIPPHKPHQMMNLSTDDVEFLLISHPNSHGDRIEKT